MEQKYNIVYRTAKKADYPAIIELIRQKNLKSWDCETEKTGKLLSRMLFYRCLSYGAFVSAAICREKVVGVLITGNEKRQRFAPLCRIKATYPFLRLKLTKEGRANLKILKQLGEMKKELRDKADETADFILFLYVQKRFRRNGIGSGLLAHLQEAEKNPYFAYADQKDNIGFLEKHGFVKVAETEQMMEVRRQRFRETVFLYRGS